MQDNNKHNTLYIKHSLTLIILTQTISFEWWKF